MAKFATTAFLPDSIHGNRREQCAAHRECANTAANSRGRDRSEGINKHNEVLRKAFNKNIIIEWVGRSEGSRDPSAERPSGGNGLSLVRHLSPAVDVCGNGTEMTSRPSMPAKSFGLQVYTGRPFARAIAAIIAS